MQSLPGRCVLLSLASWFVAIAGCTNPAVEGRSPLAPARMSPDSCVLEICLVRFPLGDPQINGELWSEVDEQQFPAELRERLARNGFRVGLLDGRMPAVLAELLKLDGDPPPADEVCQIDLAELASGLPPVRRHLEIRAGRRQEIVASGVYERLPVLIWEAGGLGGETYTQAQAVLGVRTFPEGDGRVRVELVPELQHGPPRQRYVGQQEMWRLEVGKERRVFDKLGFSATLSPGAMLVVSSLPNRPGSLGHHFLTEDDGQAEQKLLLVRLAQTQHDGLFGPAGPPGSGE